MDLRDLLSVLRTRWVVIVAATLVSGIVALVASLLTAPTYQARIQFYVTVAGGENAAASAYQGSLGAQQRVQSYAALVESSEIVEQVVDAANVDVEPAAVASSVTATADSKTVILDVAVEDSEPKRAMQLADAFGEVLPEVINRLETPDGGGPALAKLTEISSPQLPTDPIAPKTGRNVAIGLLLGFLLGVAIALLNNAFDRRVKTKEQLEQITGGPVVGSIPFREDEDRDKDAEHIVPFKEGHSPAAEAFRRLRTNLRFLNVDNPPRVIVLTSSVAMEGKSETAVNLSLALAEAGNSVLLVEADLRRPRVVNYMSMPDQVGLTNILSGQAEFAQVVQATRHEGVDLLACGPLPPNPSELLASDTAQRLFSSLRSKYDYVLVDSPPLLPVTDGALLAKITDGALLIVRDHRTTTDQVGQAVDNLRKAFADLIGTVMIANKPARKVGSYDSYYYSAKEPAVDARE